VIVFFSCEDSEFHTIIRHLDTDGHKENGRSRRKARIDKFIPTYLRQPKDNFSLKKKIREVIVIMGAMDFIQF
jgi:hypothetical protein